MYLAMQLGANSKIQIWLMVYSKWFPKHVRSIYVAALTETDLKLI